MRKTYPYLRKVPQVLVVTGKHATNYYLINSEDDLRLAALDVVYVNSKSGYYEDENDDASRAEEILDRKDGDGAIHFMFWRSDYEYERVDLFPFTTPTVPA